MNCRSRRLLVGIVLLVSIAGVSVVATGDVAAQHVDVAASDLDGSGTQDDPYVITNASELQAMEDDLDAYYELGSDIDATQTAQWNSANGFDPVGASPRDSTPTPPAFTGSLAGNNNTVTGLTIDRSDEDFVGLIGLAGEGATIRDISLTKITVNGSQYVGGLAGVNYDSIQDANATGTVSGSENVGGLIGYHTNSIETVTAMASVTGSKNVGGLVGRNLGSIENATATGNVTVSGSEDVGGLVGFSDSASIEAAIATVSVTGSEDVGGLVGYNSDGLIQNTTATGDVNGSEDVGGLVGNDYYGSIEAATATGDVNGSEDVGGLVGFLYDGSIEAAIATGDVTGSEDVGGLIGSDFVRDTVKDAYWDTETTGQSSSAGGTGLTTAQMTGQTAETNMAGLDFNSAWQIQPDGYPVLRALSTDGDNDDTGDGAGGDDDNTDDTEEPSDKTVTESGSVLTLELAAGAPSAAIQGVPDGASVRDLSGVGQPQPGGAIWNGPTDETVSFNLTPASSTAVGETIAFDFYDGSETRTVSVEVIKDPEFEVHPVEPPEGFNVDNAAEKATAVANDEDEITPISIAQSISENRQKGTVDGVEISPIEFAQLISANAGA